MNQAQFAAMRMPSRFASVTAAAQAEFQGYADGLANEVKRGDRTLKSARELLGQRLSEEVARLNREAQQYTSGGSRYGELVGEALKPKRLAEPKIDPAALMAERQLQATERVARELEINNRKNHWDDEVSRLDFHRDPAAKFPSIGVLVDQHALALRSGDASKAEYLKRELAAQQHLVLDPDVRLRVAQVLTPHDEVNPFLVAARVRQIPTLDNARLQQHIAEVLADGNASEAKALYIAAQQAEETATRNQTAFPEWTAAVISRDGLSRFPTEVLQHLSDEDTAGLEREREAALAQIAAYQDQAARAANLQGVEPPSASRLEEIAQANHRRSAGERGEAVVGALRGGLFSSQTVAYGRSPMSNP